MEIRLWKYTVKIEGSTPIKHNQGMKFVLILTNHYRRGREQTRSYIRLRYEKLKDKDGYSVGRSNKMKNR